jgi:hypothetical protein
VSDYGVEIVEGEVFIHVPAFCVKCGDRSVKTMDGHLTDEGWSCTPEKADKEAPRG